jgi:EAL and modified HD-GYP domain-containing signal transduction protein
LQAIAAAAGLFQFSGARMAWEGSLDLGIPPEFVLLRQSSGQLGALLESVHSLPALFKHKPLIVLNLSNLEDLEQVLHAGATFVSGAMASPATQAAVEAVPVKDKKPLQPQVRHVTHLLQKLAADADSAEIISDLKGDLGLSVQLLQRINSASFAHLGGVASIEQAVAMLGRQELQRWLSLILMQFAVKRKTSPALQEVALWRSRFVELLAQERGESEPGQFFTLGLASMLGLLLKISQSEVVTTLGLPLMGQQALLSHAGPWAGYLRTAKDVEAHKLTDELAEAEGFNDATRVLALSDEAWVWAAAHSDRSPR